MNPIPSYIPIYCSRNYLLFGCRRTIQFWTVTYTVIDRFNNLLAWFNGARLLLERSRAGSSVICTSSSCLCIKSDAGSGTLEMVVQAKAEGTPTWTAAGSSCPWMKCLALPGRQMLLEAAALTPTESESAGNKPVVLASWWSNAVGNACPGWAGREDNTTLPALLP